MTRPLDDLLRDIDEFLSRRSKGSAWDWPIASDWISEADTFLRECRSALATAREEGAREEREEVVRWLLSNPSAATFIGGIMAAAADIASGKHRP